MNKQLLRNSLGAIALAACALPSYAAPGPPPIPVPPPPPDCTNQALVEQLGDNVYGTAIRVDEYGCTAAPGGRFSLGGFYNLFNDGGPDVFGLAVTTNSYNASLPPTIAGPGTSVPLWTAQFLDQVAWNSTFAGYSFDTVFGPESVQGVFLYMLVPGFGAPIPVGGSVTGNTGFYFTASEPSTQFAALNSGQVIAQSYLAPPPGGDAPGPGTLALLGLGLAASALARRRSSRKG